MTPTPDVTTADSDEQRTADMAKACVIMSKAIVSERRNPVGVATQLIADALAEQRAEIHARYEKLAVDIGHYAESVGDPWDEAAEMIREVPR